MKHGGDLLGLRNHTPNNDLLILAKIVKLRQILTEWTYFT